MAHRWMMEDIERLCAEIGVEYAEAITLLLNAQGDYKKAVRLHQDQHTIFIQPEQVTEGKLPLREVWKEKWMHAGCALRRTLARLGKWARRIPVLVIPAALVVLLAPHLMLLLVLMLGGHWLISHTRRFFAQVSC